uniref:SFRICE_008844 n=1 Tax=Spodoptera frugiperda TaxID=7108 RepID=A0A2H1V4T9_SPOFR
MANLTQNANPDYLTVTEKFLMEKPNNTLSDSGITPRTSCSVVTLAITRPTRHFRCLGKVCNYVPHTVVDLSRYCLPQAGSERREVEYERVSFGEVSHAPPALHFKAAGAPRPGRRQLLLSSLLGPGAPAAGAQAAAGARAPADAERARLQAVAAYRALKANKHKNK